MLNKILAAYSKYLALWVVLFGVVAYLYPGPFISLKPLFNWFFALTMFGIGAVLSIDDFKRVARQPIIVLVGVCAQFTIMPLGAYVLGKAFGLSPELAVGLILTGSAPGAMASNVMSYIARADTAYSVSLTAVSTLLCPILTPGLTYVLAQSYLHVAFLPMFFHVILVVIVPLVCGFAIRHFWRERMEPLQEAFPAISVTFIVFICCVVLALNHDRIASVTGLILGVVIVLNLYGMSMGYGVGVLFRMERSRRRTLCIEIGMQNAGLGTALALEHFSDKPIVALPAAVFVFVCILTASVMVEIWQRNGDSIDAARGGAFPMK